MPTYITYQSSQELTVSVPVEIVSKNHNNQSTTIQTPSNPIPTNTQPPTDPSPTIKLSPTPTLTNDNRNMVPLRHFNTDKTKTQATVQNPKRPHNHSTKEEMRKNKHTGTSRTAHKPDPKTPIKYTQNMTCD